MQVSIQGYSVVIIGEKSGSLAFKNFQVGDNAKGPGPRFSGVGDRGGFGAMLESAALIGPIVPLCGGALSEYPARATTRIRLVQL